MSPYCSRKTSVASIKTGSLLFLLPDTYILLLLSSYGGFAEGVHLFPYRTEKLSPSWPMVLHKNVGE